MDDEWQAYWDQEGEDPDFVDTKAVVPFAPSGLASKVRPRSKSPEPFRHLRVRKPNGLQDLKVVERAVAAQQAVKNISASSKSFSTFSPKTKSSASSTTTGQNEQDSDDTGSEIYEKVDDLKVDEIKEPLKDESDSKLGDKNTSTSPLPGRKQAIVVQNFQAENYSDAKAAYVDKNVDTIDAKVEASPSEESSGVVVTPECDDSDDRSLIDDVTRRKLIEDAESLLSRSELRRPKKLRSSDYRLRRKYQRRKSPGSSSGSGSSSSSTSFLIDEVILEEDEEALEAENLEVISSRPVVPVKSILKRPSLTSPSSSGSSDDSESDSPRSLRDEAETDLELEHVRRRKKGVTFHVVERDVMGNATSSNDEPSTTRRVTTDERVTSSSSLDPSQSNETEDELTGYSKVVVSHNLAEEILDEIYGKLTQGIDPSQSYENADFFSSPAPPFFLFQGIEPEADNEPPRSLADEILDELYGGDQEKDFDENEDGAIREEDFYEEIRNLSDPDSNSSTAVGAANEAGKVQQPPNVNPVLAGESCKF